MVIIKKLFSGRIAVSTVSTFFLLVLFGSARIKSGKIDSFWVQRTNDSLITKTVAWKGKSKQGSNRNVKYSCPENWNTQYLDSIGRLRISPDSSFERFKITCFAPGKFPITAVEIRQADIPVTDLKKYCKDKMKEIKQMDGGKILFYEEKTDKKGTMWIDMAYEWKDTPGKLIYRDYVRHLLRGKVVYQIAYGSRGKEFYTYLPQGLFILKNVNIK